MEAMCDRIVPADGDPGAAWAGARDYIDLQLAGPYADMQALYRKGIAAADASSRAMFGKPLAELAPADADKLLQAMEKDGAAPEAWKDVRASEFLAKLVDHTMQGFYGDPRHGGNRDMVSWRMLALPYPPVRGRRHSSPPTGGKA